jgi:hypothetical protein
MNSIALIAGYYLLMFGSAAVAFKHGGLGDRLGAVWYASNIFVGAAFNLAGLNSPTAHLVSDGIFAVGLLPLAVIFASYWVGVVTLIAAALFSLEALYLINDWPIDPTYAIANNGLCLATPIILLISAVVNFLRRSSPLAAGELATSRA